MASIDAMFHLDGPVRIGDRTFAGVGNVPMRVWLQAFVAGLRERMRKHKTRRHLRELTDDQLRDIGVTRAQASFEAEKPFWWYKR